MRGLEAFVCFDRGWRAFAVFCGVWRAFAGFCGVWRAFAGFAGFGGALAGFRGFCGASFFVVSARFCGVLLAGISTHNGPVLQADDEDLAAALRATLRMEPVPWLRTINMVTEP